MTENKYHFGREIIFNLRSCHAISNDIYLHWLDKLNEEEKLTLTDVGSSTKKTRADRRNKHAENVCREARYQLAKNGGIVDNNKISDLVIKWLNYGLKICYKPL